MLSFRNDYSEGAHPQVLQALVQANLNHSPGYGTDDDCRRAADTIRDLCAAPQAQVHFLVGGTQANKTAIGAFLRPYEAVLAAHTGHICVHETGAIEHNGHKILSIPAPDGKLTPALLLPEVRRHCDEHMVLPRLVYLSNTTEIGTVYTKKELEDLHGFCQEHGLLLYCDGARLGSALTVDGADTTFADYARLCDAFTIGGTKNGLLFGEAMVLVNPALFPHFRFAMKQQGAVLAKGWLLGLQFQTILEEGRYLSIARHANEMAALLRKGLADLQVPFLSNSPSNQLFPILPASAVKELEKSCAFEVQREMEDGSLAIRFVTSWATQEADVAALLSLLKEVLA